MEKFTRTTVVIPVELHEQLKIMSVLTKTTMQNFIRIAISEKIVQLRKDYNNNAS